MKIRITKVAFAHVQGERRITFANRGEPLVDEKPGHLRRSHLLELILELAQQVLGNQLHKHSVVPLERGADVCISLQRTEPVDSQVSLPAASFATGLDRLSGIPSGERFKSGRRGFE